MVPISEGRAIASVERILLARMCGPKAEICSFYRCAFAAREAVAIARILTGMQGAARQTFVHWKSLSLLLRTILKVETCAHHHLEAGRHIRNHRHHLEPREVTEIRN